MRCPKCGYISFDHMESCLKCKKDISGKTEVEGTTYHAAAPSFLRVPEKNTPEPEVDDEHSGTISMNEDFAEDDYDFSDPNLDILVDDNESDGDITFGDQESDNDFLLDPEDESDEGGFDFDFDDEEDELGFADEAPAVSPPLTVPDELGDISDLAPPTEEDGLVASASSAISLSLDDEMSLDEDLDLDGLDLGLGLGGEDIDVDTDLFLSLDDIDLSSGDIVDESTDLDELSMDLDLDGLDSTPAPAKEKSSGSLDGISLSLD